MAAYASLVSLMHVIDDLENHPRPPISLHRKQVNLLTQKIIFLQKFLEGYNSPHLDYDAEADPLETRIVDAAHAVEDVIESHIFDQVNQILDDRENMSINMLFADDDDVAEEDAIATHTHVDKITVDGEKLISSDAALYEALEKLIEDMALIEKEAVEIEQVQHQLHTKSTPPVSSTFSSSSIDEKSKMVGADEQVIEMKDKLRSDRLALQIIPIVGMGGSGKTTLARNIYQDPLITEHFHVCAWVTISQEFSILEILVQLLKQLGEVASQDSSEGELGLMLHQHLFGRRYLIILDDMWNIEAWEGVMMFLPNKENGSRIVVTTRLSNLASKLPNSKMLEMKLLDEADSWDLLSKTVFGDEGCPLELTEIGKKISKTCKGLPLSIVVVGGLLSKSKHTTEFWMHIEKNLSSLVSLEDNERCLRTLHMSYKQLPVYLKPCFLYMSIYSEDEEISISNLTKLWVAEGFIKSISGKSLEERGKQYLMDLISRNLIFIHAWGRTGMMKYCKIHDLLRDLSLREAQKERFYRPAAQGIVNGQRRIVVSSEEAINVLPSSMPLARSFIWHLHTHPPVLDFRLLRIFMQSKAYMHDNSKVSETIRQLVNSRLIHVSNNMFPDSIWLFWNLQTFFSMNYYPNSIVPSDIWYMPHLRHFRTFSVSLPHPPKDAIDFGNLQTLGNIVNFKLSEQVVKIIPNIKKFSLCYDTKPDDEGYCLHNLVCLDKLESLEITIQNNNRELIHFPPSLQKLSLNSDSPFLEEILDKIGELPLLQKLKLFNGEFKQGHWKTSEGQFRSLKYLLLSVCNIHLWTSESSHFPRLEYLELSTLKYLLEIPLEFADITSLGVIRIWFCTDSVVVSAKRIVEEQEEICGEENLQVIILSNNAALQSLATPNFRITC